MTGFNKVFPDKEGGQLPIFYGILECANIGKGNKFCKLMKQLYQFGGNFSPFLVKKWPNIVYNIPVEDILIWASFQSFRPPRYS
jgi:hypothetical protein